MTIRATTAPAPASRTQIALALYLGFALLAFAYVCYAKGPWLDEFWGLWFGDPNVPLARLLSERWLPDPHPVFFNALLALVRRLYPFELAPLRLVVGGTVMLAMVSAVGTIAARSPRGRPFHAILLVTIVALPFTCREFSDLRSYLVQIASATVWASFAYYAAMLRPGERPSRRVVAIAAAAAFVMIATHFFAGIESSIFYAGTVAMLVWRGRRFVLWTLPAAALAWLGVLLSVWIQAPEWAHSMDVKWITTGLLGLLHIETVVGVSVLLSNPVATIACLAALPRGDAATRRFQIGMAALVVAIVAMSVIVNRLQPIGTERYFAPLYVMIAAIVAAGAVDWWRRDARVALATIAAAALVVAGNAWRESRSEGWNHGAAIVARMVRACPQTHVYALSAWTLGPDAGRETAAREWTIFDLGYRWEARRYGFDVDVLPAVPPARGIAIAASPCPALIWTEHLPPPLPPAEVLRRSGLRAPPGRSLDLKRVPGAKLLVQASLR